MNIYFTASIIGKKHYLSNYQNILKTLESGNHKVQSDHIMKTSSDEIRIESEDARRSFHKKLEKWIINADCVIAEASYPSISVGFEISYALSKGKPVLVLYSGEHIPSLLVHYADEKLICERYHVESVGSIVAEFLGYVSSSTQPRLTFFVSPTIDHYLDALSKTKKVPKSVYIRNLIEADMKKNE